MRFCFAVRNKNQFNGIKDKIIYYNLDLYRNDYSEKGEGRICLFNSFTYSVEGIANFFNCYFPYEVATTKDRVNSYVRYFG